MKQNNAPAIKEAIGGCLCWLVIIVIISMIVGLRHNYLRDRRDRLERPWLYVEQDDSRHERCAYCGGDGKVSYMPHKPWMGSWPCSVCGADGRR